MSDPLLDRFEEMGRCVPIPHSETRVCHHHDDDRLLLNPHMAKPHTSAGWPNGVNYTTTSFLPIFAACTITINVKMSAMVTVGVVHAMTVFAV